MGKPARRLDRKSYLEPSASRPEIPSAFPRAADLRVAARGPHSSYNDPIAKSEHV